MFLFACSQIILLLGIWGFVLWLLGFLVNILSLLFSLNKVLQEVIKCAHSSDSPHFSSEFVSKKKIQAIMFFLQLIRSDFSIQQIHQFTVRVFFRLFLKYFW